MFRPLPILLALLFLIALPLDASDQKYSWRLGPPLTTELGPPEPAVASAQASDLVSGGGNVLAVWDDVVRLGSHLGYQNVWAAVVSQDDQLLTSRRLLLGYGVAPRAVWTGSHWIVVWQGYREVLLAAVSPEGTVTRRATLGRADLEVFAVRIEWSGGRAVVLWNAVDRTGNEAPTHTLRAAAVDAAGDVLVPDRSIGSETGEGPLLGFVAVDRGFLVLTRSENATAVVRMMDDDLDLGPPIDSFPLSPFAASLKLERNGDAVVAVWQELDPSLLARPIVSASLNPRGNVAAHRNVIHDPGSEAWLDLAADAEGFLLAWQLRFVGADGVHLARLDEDGEPTGAPVRAAASGGSLPPVVVAPGDGRVTLLLSLDGVPHVQRLSPTLEPLGPPILISLRGPSQTPGRMAAHPAGFLMVWGEEDAEGVVAVSALVGYDGGLRREATPIGRGAPLAMIEIDSGYAVLLGADSPGGIATLVRLDASGERVGDVVAVFAQAQGEIVSLAQRGANVLVTWYAPQSTVIEGKLFDVDAGEPAAGGFEIPIGERPAQIETAATESGWYVAWREGDQWRTIYGVALTPAGEPVGTPRKLVDAGLLPYELSLATDGSTVVLAWVSRGWAQPRNDYVAVVVIASDGTVIAGEPMDPTVVTTGWNMKSLAGIWRTERGYQLAWLERDVMDEPWKFVTMLLSNDGKPLNAPPHPPIFESEVPTNTVYQWTRSGGHFAVLEHYMGQFLPQGVRARNVLRIASPVRARPARIGGR